MSSVVRESSFVHFHFSEAPSWVVPITFKTSDPESDGSGLLDSKQGMHIVPDDFCCRSIARD